MLCNESHVFYVSTEGSQELGLNYSMSISELPRCSCEGFQRREAQEMVYVPCKHMYDIFFNVLRLDANVHEFMHQAELTKVELFQALRGRRCNVLT